MTPYNTGKVKIGNNYLGLISMNDDEEIIQRVLIDKTVIEPEDIPEIIFKIIRWAFTFVAACMVAGMLYALFTHAKPIKPVPDCGSCRIYKKEAK